MSPRNMIIGALAAMAGAAAPAQTTVTLYGLLDVSPAYFSRTATVDSRVLKLMNDAGSSSRFGVRGSEDLGGGLSAIFNLESPLNPDDGSVVGGAASGACTAAAACASAANPSFWRRNAYVGLKGGFGTVTLGRNTTASVIKHVPTLSATPSGINTGMGSVLASQGISNDFWNSNQVRYDSPSFGGFEFAANVAAGEGVVGRSFGAFVGYSGGPFAVGLSTQKNENLPGKSVSWTMLSGSFAFGPAKLHAAVNAVDNDDALAGWAKSSKMYNVGVNFTASSALKLAAQYWVVTADTATDNGKSKLLVLNADYALSRRTALFALVGLADNKNIAIQPLWNSGGIVVANDKVNGFTAGIRHSF